MKIRIFFFIYLFTCFSLGLKGQSYHPFPTEQAVWSQYASFDNPELLGFAWTEQAWKYDISGDTLIQNNSYRKLFKEDTWRHEVNHPEGLDSLFNVSNNRYCIGGIREENKRIFFKSFYPEEFYGCNFMPFDSSEKLLYDFNLSPGDSVIVGNWPFDPIVLLDTSFVVLDDGTIRKEFVFRDFSWVEGIGSMGGLLRPNVEIPEYGMCVLNCFKTNEAYLLSNTYAPYCDSITLWLDNFSNRNTFIYINPNPLINVSEIGFQKGHSNSFQISVYTVLGQLIFTDLMSSAQPYTLDRSIFPATGYYLVKVFNPSASQFLLKKILVMD